MLHCVRLDLLKWLAVWKLQKPVAGYEKIAILSEKKSTHIKKKIPIKKMWSWHAMNEFVEIWVYHDTLVMHADRCGHSFMTHIAWCQKSHILRIDCLCYSPSLAIWHWPTKLSLYCMKADWIFYAFWSPLDPFICRSLFFLLFVIEIFCVYSLPVQNF